MEGWCFMEAHLLTFWGKASAWLVNYSPKFLVALLIFVIGVWVAKGVSHLISRAVVKTSPQHATGVRFIQDIIYYLLYLMVIIAALAQLGIPTTSFVAILGTIGLAIGFALKDSLGNLASGVMIIFFKPMELGDSITVAGESGTVDAVGIFNTTILTADDTKIIIPNSAITSGNIKNFSVMPDRRADIKIKISYSDDIKTAKNAISALFPNDSRILKTPEPAIVVSNLAENGVELSVRMWCKNADYWGLFFDMNEKIKEAVQKAEVTILVPSVMQVSSL